jgi:DNA invertase Pin-like site-specific DNA recombinase
MDTTTPGGKLMLHEFAAPAAFERDVIRKRTQAGLNAARARGRNGGRPRKLSRKGLELAVTMLSEPNTRIDDIRTTVGISRAPRYLCAKAAMATYASIGRWVMAGLPVA